MERLAHVVVGDQDAHAALPEILDDFLDVGDGERIDARERLVEQDELRLEREAARNLDAAALTARKLRAAPLLDVLDVKLFEQGFILVFLLGFREVRCL